MKERLFPELDHPSVPGTANRLTDRRGIENRGVESRGLENRGVDRFRSGNRHTAATPQMLRPGPGASAPAAGRPAASSSTSTPLGQAFEEIRHTFLVSSQQTKAVELENQLLPHFSTAFSRGARRAPLNQRIGKFIPIKVLNQAAFAAEVVQLREFQYRQSLKALVTYRPEWVAAELAKVQKVGSLVGTYGNPPRVGPQTVLHPEDAIWFYPRPRMAARSKAAAFYSEQKNVIYLHEGEVHVGLIAHEMCHAYTHQGWNAFVMQFSMYPTLTEAMSTLDEAVTSELASSALTDWFLAQRRGGGPNLGTKPDGYYGYGPTVRAQGDLFLRQVADPGQLSAGPTTEEAYFAGAVRATANPKQPFESSVMLGRRQKATKLGTLLVR